MRCATAGWQDAERCAKCWDARSASLPRSVTIRRGVRGRPELADAAARIDFNVTHTRGVALVAIARDVAPTTRIGVDIEHADRDVGVDLLARKFLTSRERKRSRASRSMRAGGGSCATGRARKR